MPPESPRIAELRRRVQADPASIAFAQLAEEFRRSGNYQEAVRYCRSGLSRHPGYLSARVTLGRALIELGVLDEAAHEFDLVLKSAPDNLAAIRGMGEIHQRRGDMHAALEYYQRALALARFDRELEETVNRIGREMGAVASPSTHEGLSFEQAASELLSAATRMPAVTPATPATGTATDSPAALEASSAPDAPTAPDAPNALSAPNAPNAPSAPNAPNAPSAPNAPEPLSVAANSASPRPDLIDFDALLASLGVPDASPPPMMQMLLSNSAAAIKPQDAAPHLPPPAAAQGSGADLPHERAGDEPPSQETAVAAVVEELEAWLRVLHHERAPQGA